MLGLKQEIDINPKCSFEYKRLDQIRGYLCHLAMTFDIFFAYLKGFHLTLSQHLPKNTDEGWKMSDFEWIGYVEERFRTDKISTQEKDRLLSELPGSGIPPPKFVSPILRFYQCLDALLLFFEPKLPPCVHMRSTSVYMLAYCFLDASGSGFGSTIERDGEISYRMGVWDKDEDGECSNWKEFENLVQTLEAEATNERMKGSLVILAVDNATVESCIYKGNSSSPKLFQLELRFKQLELHSGAR